MLAYCFKCKTKREIKDPKTVVLKNKRSAIQGICPVCGTKIFRILKKQIIETVPTTNPQLAPQPACGGIGTAATNTQTRTVIIYSAGRYHIFGSNLSQLEIRLMLLWAKLRGHYNAGT